MPRLPDLVRDSQLTTEFKHGLTVHSYHVSDTRRHRRSVVEQVRWQKGAKIGVGGVGSVHVEKRIGKAKAHHPELRAVKRIRDATHKEYLHELVAIAKFSHPSYERCFVKSYGWYEDGDSLCIAMEYLKLGDLQQSISMMPPLEEKDVTTITLQILEGLYFMHDNDFAHRDMKPKNVLVMWRPPDFPSWWVKIADFGISKRFEEDADGTTVLQGTPKFMAPELIFRKHKPLREQKPRDHFAADIWAVGCTIWYMFTKTVPFQDWSALSAYYERNAWGSMPELPSEVCDDMGQTFVKNLLYADPDDRPNAEGCLDFAWLHKFSRDDVDEDDDAAHESSSDHETTPRASIDQEDNAQATSLITDTLIREDHASARWTTIVDPTNARAGLGVVDEAQPDHIVPSRRGSKMRRPAVSEINSTTRKQAVDLAPLRLLGPAPPPLRDLDWSRLEGKVSTTVDVHSTKRMQASLVLAAVDEVTAIPLNDANLQLQSLPSRQLLTSPIKRMIARKAVNSPSPTRTQDGLPVLQVDSVYPKDVVQDTRGAASAVTLSGLDNQYHAQATTTRQIEIRLPDNSARDKLVGRTPWNSFAFTSTSQHHSIRGTEEGLIEAIARNGSSPGDVSRKTPAVHGAPQTLERQNAIRSYSRRYRSVGPERKKVQFKDGDTEPPNPSEALPGLGSLDPPQPTSASEGNGVRKPALSINPNVPRFNYSGETPQAPTAETLRVPATVTVPELDHERTERVAEPKPMWYTRPINGTDCRNQNYWKILADSREEGDLLSRRFWALHENPLQYPGKLGSMGPAPETQELVLISSPNPYLCPGISEQGYKDFYDNDSNAYTGLSNVWKMSPEQRAFEEQLVSLSQIPEYWHQWGRLL